MIVFLLRLWYFFLGETYLLIHGKPCMPDGPGGIRYRVVSGYARTRNGRKIRDRYQSKWMHFPYPPEPDF